MHEYQLDMIGVLQSRLTIMRLSVFAHTTCALAVVARVDAAAFATFFTFTEEHRLLGRGNRIVVMNVLLGLLVHKTAPHSRIYMSDRLASTCTWIYMSDRLASTCTWLSYTLGCDCRTVGLC